MNYILDGAFLHFSIYARFHRSITKGHKNDKILQIWLQKLNQKLENDKPFKNTNVSRVTVERWAYYFIIVSSFFYNFLYKFNIWQSPEGLNLLQQLWQDLSERQWGAYWRRSFCCSFPGQDAPGSIDLVNCRSVKTSKANEIL